MAKSSYKKIDKNLVTKILDVVDAGLTNGKGTPIPGKMCVEAAVCYAMGEPHSDEPKCVDRDIRECKIELNDHPGWATNKHRARGLRRVAVAQLGSLKIDLDKFWNEMLLRTLPDIGYLVHKGPRKPTRELAKFIALCKTPDADSLMDLRAYYGLLSDQNHNFVHTPIIDLLSGIERNDDGLYTAHYYGPGMIATFLQVRRLARLKREKRGAVNTTGSDLTIVANRMADALAACGTEGGKFLKMVDGK